MDNATNRMKLPIRREMVLAIIAFYVLVTMFTVTFKRHVTVVLFSRYSHGRIVRNIQNQGLKTSVT